MINNIMPGAGINIIGSGTGMPWIDMNRPSAGLVRFNNGFEIYDGSSWIRMDGAHPTVELDLSAQAAIRWANGKMEEERQLLELAKTHPTVADALLARDRAEDAVKIAAALCKV